MSDHVDRDPEDALLRAAALLMEARDSEQLEAAVRLAKLVPRAHGLESTSEARHLGALKLPGEGLRRVDPDAYSRMTHEAREEAIELLRSLATRQSVSPVERLRIIKSGLADLSQASEVHGEILRAIGLLQDALGAEDSSVRGLESLTLPNEGLQGYSPHQYALHVQRTTSTAARVLDGAIERLAASARSTPEGSVGAPSSIYESTVDPDLWSYIGTLVLNDDWQHVASAACRFLEHQLRASAVGMGSEVDGPTLATRLFGQGASLALGHNEGQRQGWEQLVRGLLMGPRNAVQHGIDDRQSPELRRFASGVVGTVTLILTELRERHPQRFRQPDVGPEVEI